MMFRHPASDNSTQHKPLNTENITLAAKLLFRMADVGRFGFGVYMRISSESDSQVSITATLRNFVIGVAARRTASTAEACCIPEASAGLGSCGERSCQMLDPHGLATRNSSSPDSNHKLDHMCLLSK